MNIGRFSFLMTAGFLLAAAAVLATSIAPEVVVGKSEEIGATSHNLVRCILWDYYAPHNIVQGYFQISGTLRRHPLQSDPHVFLTIMSESNTLASLTLGATEMDSSTALYNFTIRRELLKDSFIDVYAPTQYVQLRLSTVRVLTEREYDKLTLSKALGPSRHHGGLPSEETNAPSRKQ